jgi:HlyD family type I secretion membrane fusion protein
LAILKKTNALYADLQGKGLETQSKVLDSLQKMAVSRQELAERKSRIGKLQESIKLAALQLEDVWKVRIDEVATEMSSVEEEILAANNALASYRDVLDRTTVTSPVNGTLISLAVNTEGSVLGAGQTIVEIVPRDDALKLEVKVDPGDVDVVKPGQLALVTLLSYPQRNLPKIHATLDEVSADSLVDSDDGSSYYTAKLTIAHGEIEKLGEDTMVLPGMPVQAMIQTSSRTFFDYLLSPLFNYAELAFRE